MLCHVRVFKPQFASLVESGVKCQTVRPTPKRLPKPGDRISLRMWTGKPYRSKQRVLREAEISAVEKITLCDTGRELLVGIGNKSLTPEELNAFAAADGFKNGLELFSWFEATHGLPFEGVVIKWHNEKLRDRRAPAPGSALLPAGKVTMHYDYHVTQQGRWWVISARIYYRNGNTSADAIGRSHHWKTAEQRAYRALRKHPKDTRGKVFVHAEML